MMGYDLAHPATLSRSLSPQSTRERLNGGGYSWTQDIARVCLIVALEFLQNKGRKRYPNLHFILNPRLIQSVQSRFKFCWH